MDPGNPIVRLCAAGIAAEGEGRPDAARAAYERAWTESGSDYEACIAAHYLARLQDSADAALRWNAIALERAERTDAGLVRDFLPSLWLNLGYSHERLSDTDEARRCYERALEQAHGLPPCGYTTMVLGGIRNGLARIDALAAASVTDPANRVPYRASSHFSRAGGEVTVAIEVVAHEAASAELLEEIVALCEVAYEEELAELFYLYDPVAHVLARENGRLVSHAMWVERHLQIDRDQPIRTGYIEFVATHPQARGRGLAKAVMERAVDEIRRVYTLAALCPAVPDFYRRLGWRDWTGPREIRESDGSRTPTPDEEIMILWLGEGAGPDVSRTLSIEWREGEVW